MGERMTEMNDSMTELERGRNNPTFQSVSLVKSYGDLVGTTNSSTNVFQTPPPADRLVKLEYNSSEKERSRKLLQVKVTYRPI